MILDIAVTPASEDTQGRGATGPGLLSSVPTACAITVPYIQSHPHSASAGPSFAARTSTQSVCFPLDLPERREKKNNLQILPPRSFLANLPVAGQNQKADDKEPWRTWVQIGTLDHPIPTASLAS